MGFLEVYKSGESKNLEGLASIKGSIDEYEPGGTDSAVSRLAFEGKFSSMEFLLSHGANINEAVKGAARGGHKNYVNQLLERGADISWAAVGAISGKNKDFTESYLQRGADKGWAAMRAISGKNKDFAKAYLNIEVDAGWMAYEDARLGHTDLHNLLDYTDSLAEGAARGGHREYADGLFMFGANPNCAVRGAAQGGHIDYANILLDRGAGINFAAQGAAQGGHIEYANELLAKGASINLAAQGAAQGGHHAYAADLLSKNSSAIRDAKAPLIKALVSGAIEGKQISATVNSQLRWLSFFPPEMIPYLCTDIRSRAIFKIDESTEARAINMSNHMRQSALIYPDAYFITGEDARNMMLYFVVASKKNLSELPVELIINTQQFLCPEPVTSKSYDMLTTMRERFFAQQSERKSTSNSPISFPDSGLGPTPISPRSPDGLKEFDLETAPKDGSDAAKGPGVI